MKIYILVNYLVLNFRRLKNLIVRRKREICGGKFCMLLNHLTIHRSANFDTLRPFSRRSSYATRDFIESILLTLF